MIKAFLSHSSQDKQFVEAVARHLGRARVNYDSFAFTSDQDFRDAIRGNLDLSSLFVFFVSRKSLDSVWCRFELDQAELRKLKGGIRGQLALIIDEQVSYSELPAWMQGARAIHQPGPKRAAREIENALLAQISPDSRKPFIGRQPELQRFAQDLVPYGGEPRHVLIAFGLDGVGRKSFLERAVGDNLGLRWGPVFVMDSVTGLDDLYLWLVDETGSLESRTRLLEEADAFGRLDKSQQIEECTSRLIQLSDENTVPCIVDEGGLLNDNGTYLNEFGKIIDGIAASDSDSYVAVIHRRRPYIPDSYTNKLVSIRLEPLSNDDTRLLLIAALRSMKISLQESEIQEFVEYLDGYPPAVLYLSSLLNMYGVDATLANKSALEDFKARRFERFISGLEITDSHWNIVRYLVGEQPLPLRAIATAVDMPEEKVAGLIRTLIDLSIMSPSGRNYAVAAPVRTAISRVGGLLPLEQYRAIAQRLRARFWVADDAPSIEIIDATMRASALGGVAEDAAMADIIRARLSTVQRIADQSYNNRDYERALSYARRAQKLDPNRRGLSTVIFKSLVRLERWQEAGEELAKIEESGDRQYHFLNGFGLRRRGLAGLAAAEFRRALEVGDTRTAVYRELAFCLYVTSRYDEALKECNRALTRDSENLYLLDLLVLIQIARRDFVDAERALRLLDAVDFEQRFIYHRRATYWLKLRDWDRALEYAELAAASGHSQFEAFAQKVSILIDKQDHEGAEAALVDLIARFPREKHDVKVGLRVKSLARKGYWRDGLVIWEELREKDRPVHQGLRKALLILKSRDQSLTLVEREEALREADSIAADLGVLEDLSTLLDSPESE
jgi:tetratricopeptide (TPR) repeat protein/predicted transcriptional regulator